MKFTALFFLFLSVSSYSAPEFWNGAEEGNYVLEKNFKFENFDESINFQPGLDLYSEAATLTDLYGTKGSQLCAPNALTHLTNFLKYAHNPAFEKLLSVPDVDQDGTANTYRDQIRHFFNICGTDRETGTFYQSALECMKTFIVSSGYTPWTYMIGAHSKDGESTLTAVTPDVLRYYLANQVGVVMMIGWYQKNASNEYVRTAGHFFNLYGYDYDKAWGSEKIVLKSVNSWINYQGRARTQMFDDISMEKIETGIPNIQYEIKGPGFDFTEYKAFVDDILVVLPVAN